MIAILNLDRETLTFSLAVYILDLAGEGVCLFFVFFCFLFIFIPDAQLIVSSDSLRVELMRMITGELRESYLVFIVIIEKALT